MDEAGTRLDEVAPGYDIAVAHAAVLRAPPARCLQALRRLDVTRQPVIGFLLGVRALPVRLAGRPVATSPFRIDDLAGRLGWVVLAEEPGTELVVGQVLQPWRPATGPPPDAPADAAGFAAFDRPGYAKVALSLRADPRGPGSSVLTVETRVTCTDALARRRFRRYWTVVGPFSALLRRSALRMLARELEPPRIEGEIVVARPPEVVFDAVADERREPDYNPDLLSVEKVTPGPIGVGTRFRGLHTGLRRPVAMDTVLTEYEPPARLSLTSTMAWADVTGSVTFEPVPAGTRMRWSWQVRTRGAYRLLGPIVSRVGGRQEAAVWAGLKRLLETPAQAGAMPETDDGTGRRRPERVRTWLEHELDSRSIRFAAWLYRRTDGRIVRLWRRRALLLTTTGRRSGQQRTVPVAWFPDGDAMVVVAANSGLDRHPAWYLNLRAQPRARVEVDGRTLEVTAEQLTAEEARRFWAVVLRHAPDYAKYRRRTDREIPLLRLVPAGG